MEIMMFSWTKPPGPPPQNRPEPCLKKKHVRKRRVANKENEPSIGNGTKITAAATTTIASVACHSIFHILESVTSQNVTETCSANIQDT